MERAFVEFFDSPQLNVTRWQDSSLHGLFHCTKGSAKSKASADKFCTMALRQNLQVRIVPIPVRAARIAHQLAFSDA